MSGSQIGLLFVALSLLFFGLWLRDFVRSKGIKTPARRAWMRIAIIFGAIGAYLYLSQRIKIP